MAITLDQLLYGIREVESGGLGSKRYSVVNSIGAVGAYQVMKGNIPKWSKMALGHAMTWQEFRDNPHAQDQIARYMLGKFLKQYGTAEKAAAVWFSGKPNEHSQVSDGYNTVEQYVEKMVTAAQKGSISEFGQNTNTGFGSKKEANLSLADMGARFGLSVEVLKQNKQIRDLVKQAIGEGWDQTLFQAYLKNTPWWRTTSDAERKFFFLKASDPATYKEKWDQYKSQYNQLAVQVGLGSQINGKNQSTQLLQNAILHKMRDGWTDARIKSYLGQAVGMHGDVMWGEAGDAYDQLFQLAYANGMSFSKDWYTRNIKSVMAGTATLERFQGEIRQKAAAKYSAFSNQIKAGQNVMDLASPYINSVSQILELPSTEVDLNNRWVNQAMTSKSPNGTQMPLWEFENKLRDDPQWKKTNNARESMFGTAHQVLRDFGLTF